MNSDELRKKRNKELLDRMKDPEDSLTNGITKQDMLYPPRPVIKKDKEKVRQLFGEKNEVKK